MPVVVVLAISPLAFAAEVTACENQFYKGSRNNPDMPFNSIKRHLPRRRPARRTGSLEEAEGTGRRAGRKRASRHGSRPAPGTTASAEACAGSAAEQEEEKGHMG